MPAETGTNDQIDESATLITTCAAVHRHQCVDCATISLRTHVRRLCIRNVATQNNMKYGSSSERCLQLQIYLLVQYCIYYFSLYTSR